MPARIQSAPQQAALEHTRHAVRADLDALLARAPALRFACVCTSDGRLLTCASTDDRLQGERLAAMTSSTLALCESFSKEALRSHCDYSVISTASGAIVVVRVPHAARRYMLSIAADDSQILASTLRSALDTAARIAAIVEPATAH